MLFDGFLEQVLIGGLNSHSLTCLPLLKLLVDFVWVKDKGNFGVFPECFQLLGKELEFSTSKKSTGKKTGKPLP